MEPNTCTHKRRGGRKPLPENERRCIRIQPSFTVAEMDEVEQRAEALGVDVAEWLRIAALGATVKSVPSVNRVAYAELSRLAANLNQLAARANSTGVMDEAEVISTAKATHAAVQSLRAELLGGAA